MVPDHTRGAHPTASGRLQTVVLFRQSYPALTNGGVDNAVVPCGTGALLTQTTLRTWRQLSCNLGSRLQLRARWGTVLRRRGLLPVSSRTRGARWATVLRHRGLLPPKELEVERVVLESVGNLTCRPWSSSNSSINRAAPEPGQ